MPDSILRVESLDRSFGGVRAVSDLSFEVARGSITSLVGPNGSGKTTALDLITGHLKPDAGRVFLDGRDLTGVGLHRMSVLGVRRTFQNLRCLGGMSVRDHMLLAVQTLDRAGWLASLLRTQILRDSERQANARCREILEMVHLDGREDDIVEDLSYGQQKLLALGTGLMCDPQLLCLDEPLAGVTPGTIAELVTILKDINASGQAFLIVEHNMEFVAEIADRVIIMSGGTKQAEGPPRMLWEDAEVLEAFLGGGHVD